MTLGIGPLTDRLDGLNPGAVRSICIHGETDPMYFFSGGIYDPSESRDVSNWLTKEAASSRHTTIILILTDMVRAFRHLRAADKGN